MVYADFAVLKLGVVQTPTAALRCRQGFTARIPFAHTSLYCRAERCEVTLQGCRVRDCANTALSQACWLVSYRPLARLQNDEPPSLLLHATRRRRDPKAN